MPHTSFLHTLRMVFIFRTDCSGMTYARTKVEDDKEEEEEEKEKRGMCAAREECEKLWKGRIRMGWWVNMP